MLFPVLLIPIMTGCVTTSHKIELPPKPERKEIEAPQNLKDCVQIINYYEHLVQEWELWGDTVEKLNEDR